MYIFLDHCAPPPIRPPTLCRRLHEHHCIPYIHLSQRGLPSFARFPDAFHFIEPTDPSSLSPLRGYLPAPSDFVVDPFLAEFLTHIFLCPQDRPPHPEGGAPPTQPDPSVETVSPPPPLPLPPCRHIRRSATRGSRAVGCPRAPPRAAVRCPTRGSSHGTPPPGPVPSLSAVHPIPSHLWPFGTHPPKKSPPQLFNRLGN